MDKNIKQPIWEASNGPLFLKSVWIEDKGYRHFILDHDRTVRKRRSFFDNKKGKLFLDIFLVTLWVSLPNSVKVIYTFVVVF